MTARPFSLSFLLACVCLVAACAAQAPPRPPRVQRPEKVTGLTVRQTGESLRLEFKAPLLATDGRRLTKPIGVEIFRRAGPANPGVSRSSSPGRLWMEIAPDDVFRFKHGQDVIVDDRLTPREFDASLGEIFSFVVVTFTRGFRGQPRKSDPSNPAQTQLLNVSPPVQNVRVVQKRSGLDLRWSRPGPGFNQRPLAPLAGYHIYRSQDQRGVTDAVRATTKNPLYLDRKFEYDRTYYYRVSAIFTQDGYTAQTSESKIEAVTPRDIFPPRPPAGLEAVYTGRAVELIWKAATEAAVQGYDVYREGADARPVRLNRSLLHTPVFADRSARRGEMYVYWVTAVDAAGNESLPSVPITTRTR